MIHSFLQQESPFHQTAKSSSTHLHPHHVLPALHQHLSSLDLKAFRGPTSLSWCTLSNPSGCKGRKILALIVQDGSEIWVTPHFDIKQEGICPPSGDAVASPSLLPFPPLPEEEEAARREGEPAASAPARPTAASAAWQHSPLAAGAEKKLSEQN